ncbi:RING-H2 finger protein ATL22 [Drosophila teissieri]|uniref:RING-H2 finger protein ATL22 n=1 Tax=Drosophila teissieri TaxID=7243 RepID=UPI001CBA259A|nr:RING-H2 finger protein ATL22 [Drosophila teissieri]
MSSSSTDPLSGMKSLVARMILMQFTERLFLTAQHLLDAEASIEERVRRLEVLNSQMVWFNSERTRILEQLQMQILSLISEQQRIAMDTSQYVNRLHEGLIELKRRLSSMQEDITCPICLSPWTSHGGHRVVSLRCGHLFGNNCIRTAIRRSHRCPICRRRALHADVRRIFSRRLIQ